MLICRPGVACKQSPEITRVIPFHQFIEYPLHVVCETILFSSGGEELFPCARGIPTNANYSFMMKKSVLVDSYIICKAYTSAKEWLLQPLLK